MSGGRRCAMKPRPSLTSWGDVEQLTEDIAAIADWKAELQRRLARARRLLDAGLPDPSFASLEAEIADFIYKRWRRK